MGNLWAGMQGGMSESIPWDASAEGFLQSGGKDLPSTSRAKFVTGPTLHMLCHEIASRMLIVTLLIPLWSNAIMHIAVIVPGKE